MLLKLKKSGWRRKERRGRMERERIGRTERERETESLKHISMTRIRASKYHYSVLQLWRQKHLEIYMELIFLWVAPSYHHDRIKSTNLFFIILILIYVSSEFVAILFFFNFHNTVVHKTTSDELKFKVKNNIYFF